MSAKTQKALSAFLQMVNPKIEPLIEGIWARKITTKGKEEPRFLVATNAALYVCKPATFSKCIKISQTYGWTRLVSIQAGVNDLTVFTFKDIKHPLRCVIDDPQTYVQKLFNTIRTILPDYHPATYGEGDDEVVRRRPTQFLDLFLSECHAAGISPNQSFLLNLRSSLRQRHMLCIDSSFEQRWLGPAMKALVFAESVKRFQVHGRSDFELFTALVPCIVQNTELKSITVCDCQNMKGLAAFTEACGLAKNLKVLAFKRVSFKKAIMDELVEKINATSVKKLAFIECGNDTSAFERVWQMPDKFKTLRKLELSGCKIRHSEMAVLESIRDFCNVSGLVSLSLAKTCIDIPEFFVILSQNTPALRSLDLSGNDFGNKVTDYTIPASVEVLTLSSVNWSSGALAEFLGQNHILGSSISLDISSIKAKHHVQDQMLQEIARVVPSLAIVNLKWNGNLLTSTFLGFLERLLYLKSLSLDGCSFHKEEVTDVIESLASLLTKSELLSVSINQTFLNVKSALGSLKDAFVHAKALRKLDFSGNGIGAQGMEVLKAIVLESATITDVAFDDSDIPRLGIISSFISAVLGMTRAVHISKPKTDLHRLYQKSSRGERKELRDLWTRLIEKEQEDGRERRMTDDFSSLISMTNFSSMTSMNSVSSTMNMSSLAEDYDNTEPLIDISPITNQQTSWDMQIELPCECDLGEWMRLKQTFSVQTLIGVNADSKAPLENTFIRF